MVPGGGWARARVDGAKLDGCLHLALPESAAVQKRCRKIGVREGGCARPGAPLGEPLGT